jgi:hypothetical protein
MAADKPQDTSGGNLPSPWMTIDAAIDYITSGARTEGKRRIISRRFIAKQVAMAQLRAARIGGRGQLFFTQAWLDAYMEAQAKPVLMPVRRLA